MRPASTFVGPISPPKYFAIDIDGTFFTTNQKAFEKNRRAFRKMVEEGYVPFLATGRSYETAVIALRDIMADGLYSGYPGVYHNGALVYDKDKTPICRKAFNKSFIRDVCDAAIKMGIESCLVFLSETKIYSLVAESECADRLAKIWDWNSDLVVRTADEIVELDILQIMLSRYNELAEHIKGREGVDYITRIGDRGMGDLNPPGINKSTGLKAMMEKYGAAPEDFCFIGDGTNDIEAMEFVPLSFAVGNAQDCVKSHARFVMDETNDDGAFSKLVQLVYGIQVD